MAILPLIDGYVLLNATNWSANISKIELPVEVEELDATCFNSAGWKGYVGGLKGSDFAVTFKQDFAASALDSVFWPLIGTIIPFEIRPTSAARGTGNPAYTGNVLVSHWTPIGNQVGELAEVDVTWKATGPITRQTS